MKRWTLSLLGALVLAAPAMALETEPYSPERLAELQADDALVLVDVWAEWCPTCARQHEILEEFRQAHPEVDLHILSVDFDDDKHHVRELRAPRQSTLLLYRGEEQFWYSVAETRRDVIFENILQAAEFD